MSTARKLLRCARIAVAAIASFALRDVRFARRISLPWPFVVRENQTFELRKRLKVILGISEFSESFVPRVGEEGLHRQPVLDTTTRRWRTRWYEKSWIQRDMITWRGFAKAADAHVKAIISATGRLIRALLIRDRPTLHCPLCK